MKARSSSFRHLLASPVVRLGVLSVPIIPAAQAIDYSWAVTGTSSWSTATNWTPNGIPGAGDTIAIGGTAATAVTLDSAKSITSVTINNTGTTAISSVGGPFGLTLGSGGLNVATGSGLVTLGATTAATNVPITLEASQTWASATTGTHLVRGSISGTNVNLTLNGNYDLRTHGGGTPTINLGTGILTQSGSVEIGTGVNTMGGYVLRNGFVFARNTGNFGTTGTITLGDSAANSGSVALRLATGTGNWARPIILASGTTGTILIDNLGTPNSPVLTGGITGTNNLTLQSTISAAAGAVTFNTGALDFTGALILKNQGTGSAAAAAGTLTINSAITDKVTTVTTQDVTTGTKGLQRVVLGSTANAWTGATTISSNSRVELGASEVIPHGAGKGDVTLNGLLVLRTATGDSTETINGLSGAGSINRTGASGTSTLVVGSNDGGGTFTGPITNGSGIVALTKAGTGTLVMSGANTYTGMTTVSSGTLTLEFADMIADTANIEVSAGATLNLTHGETEVANSLRFDGIPQATGTWGAQGNALADFTSSRITGTGMIEVTNLVTDSYWDGTGNSWSAAASWTVTPANPAINPTEAPSFVSATRFGADGLAANQSINLNGDQGSSGMSFTSPVLFSFLGGNADHLLEIGTGGILMSDTAGGALFGSATAGQKVDLLLSGNQTWSNLSAGAATITAKNGVDLGASTLTVTGTGGTTLEGAVIGTGKLAKSGAGKLTLGGDSSFSGGTTVNNSGGTLAITSGTALGTGTVAIPKGGTSTGMLELSNDIVVANNFTFASATGFGGNGTAHIRNVSGNNTLTGTLTLTATGGNGINLESVAGLLTVTNTVASTVNDSSRTLNITGTGDGLISGNITDNGANRVSLTKAGTGTWTLSGTNTYSNTTTVSAGKLVLSGNARIADNGAVNVAAGATLQLDFVGQDTITAITLGGVLQGPGVFNASHPSGLITGTGSLVIPDPDPFTPWINTFTFEAGADKTKAGDPDHDGLSNVEEFGLDGNPASAASTGKVVMKIDGGHLTLTLPVRTGAAFTGLGPLTSGLVNGLIYRIDGSGDLSGYTTAAEETAVLSTNLPDLTPGWTYRTFRLTSPVSAVSKGFLRADVTAP